MQIIPVESKCCSIEYNELKVNAKQIIPVESKCKSFQLKVNAAVLSIMCIFSKIFSNDNYY